MGHPTIYPTGVTVYNPDKAYNGYTVAAPMGKCPMLIGMNGQELRFWEGVPSTHCKMLPGGNIMAQCGLRDPRYGYQDSMELAQIDWDGKVVWRFDRGEFIEDPGYPGRWMARTHHDFQREGNPVGYYAPGMNARADGGNSLMLAHRNLHCKNISDQLLVDDIVYEVNWKGEIIWEWVCSDHFEEMGFSAEARAALFRDPNNVQRGKLGGKHGVAPDVGDWMHINSLSVLGPNKWHDAGDQRFNPSNLIMDGRETGIIFIIDKKTGKIVWQVGPDYNATSALQELGWIIGQHHAHMIPRGLPGEGNILVYDNGGWSGYGAPNPASPNGVKYAQRDYSRVLEFDPTTLKIVWQYTPAEAGFMMPLDANRFYSPFISAAQRLPNGNTLITEGSTGRVFEVTAEHELVWEWKNPYKMEVALRMFAVYRAYRVPFEWVPQLEAPKPVAIAPLDVSTFRVPGAAPRGAMSTVKVDGGFNYDGPKK